MQLRRSHLFGTLCAFLFASVSQWSGWLGCDAAHAQGIRVAVPVPDETDVHLVPGFQNPENGNRAETAQRWIRGFIQNEFDTIQRVCEPSPESAQQLVDIAEKEWSTRLSNAIRAYAEAQNQRISTDFESRVERLVQIWVRDVLPEELQQRWQKEIDRRLAYRKRVVVGRMVIDTERKYGLTHEQMVSVAVILEERWKDSWWSMYRTGTLPETKFAWISKILSDSQRTIGTDRSTRFTEHFVGGGVVDMPSLPLHQRFTLGAIISSEEIPIQTTDTRESTEQNMIPLLDVSPKILGPDRDPRR
jgi:hypothetical protein